MCAAGFPRNVGRLSSPRASTGLVPHATTTRLRDGSRCQLPRLNLYQVGCESTEGDCRGPLAAAFPCNAEVGRRRLHLKPRGASRRRARGVRRSTTRTGAPLRTTQEASACVTTGDPGICRGFRVTPVDISICAACACDILDETRHVLARFATGSWAWPQGALLGASV
jgi:hypothetical protein